jgi:hypothetical protein
MLHATVHNLRKLAAHRDKLPPTSPKRFRGSTTAKLNDVGQALRALVAALNPAPVLA